MILRHPAWPAGRLHDSIVRDRDRDLSVPGTSVPSVPPRFRGHLGCHSHRDGHGQGWFILSVTHAPNLFKLSSGEAFSFKLPPPPGRASEVTVWVAVSHNARLTVSSVTRLCLGQGACHSKTIWSWKRARPRRHLGAASWQPKVPVTSLTLKTCDSDRAVIQWQPLSTYVHFSSSSIDPLGLTTPSLATFMHSKHTHICTHALWIDFSKYRSPGPNQSVIDKHHTIETHKHIHTVCSEYKPYRVCEKKDLAVRWRTSCPNRTFRQ